MKMSEFLNHFFKSPLGILICGVLLIALAVALSLGVKPLVAIPVFFIVAFLVIIGVMTSKKGIQSVKSENERTDFATNVLVIQKAKEKSRILSKLRISEKDVSSKITAYLYHFEKYIQLAEKQGMYEPAIFMNLDKVLDAVDIYIEKKNEQSVKTHFTTDDSGEKGVAIESIDDAKKYLFDCISDGADETKNTIDALEGTIDDRLEIGREIK